MSEIKPISIDGGGFDVLKDAMLALLNEYPGMDGRTISYMGLGEDQGISMEPESGARISVTAERQSFHTSRARLMLDITSLRFQTRST